MKRIVKVQIPLSSSETNPPALVYDESRKWNQTIPVTEELLRACGSRMKGYFYAEVSSNGVTLIGPAPLQSW